MTFVRIDYRQIRADGTLDVIRTGLDARVGTPSMQLYHRVPDGDAVIGVVVGGTTRVTTLGLRHKRWDSNTRYLAGGERLSYATGSLVTTQVPVDIRVADNHVLAGLGLRATSTGITHAAFNQRMPRFTERVGGVGGQPHLLKCSSGNLGVGLQVSLDANGNAMFLGMLARLGRSPSSRTRLQASAKPRQRKAGRGFSYLVR